MLHLCREALYEGLSRLHGDFMPGGRVRRLFAKRSEIEHTDVLMMPTLGRPFELGALYDLRSDKIVPGINLWDPDDLKKDLTSSSLPKREFEVSTEDRIEDKASALNIDDRLKMSLLGGLVNVEGSAKYLDDRIQSNGIARVTLKYECTTKFEQLSMNHLRGGNVRHPSVFGDKNATHVVVGLLYGARAFFVFDKEISDKETHKNIHGALKVMVESIPSITDVPLTLTENQKKQVDKMRCVFHGDFLTEHNPTTFYDAVKTFHQLPYMLGENDKEAVPVRVWLYPLSNLDANAVQLVTEISAGLIKQTEGLFEEFQLAQQTCNELKTGNICNHFLDIKNSIMQFNSHLTAYVLTLKNCLSDTLPKIRGGSMDEKTLAQLLRNNKSGPFSNYSIMEWLNGKRKEREILEAYMDVMKNLQFISAPGELDNLVAGENDIVCFHFNLNSCDDQQIKAMNAKLDLESANKMIDYDDHKSNEDSIWNALRDFDDDETRTRNWSDLSITKRAMRETAYTFCEYQKINSSISFIVSTYDDPAIEKGCSIEVYKDGTRIAKNFKPPTEPSAPNASDITFDSITLTWLKPSYGAEFIQRYKILYKVANDPCWICLKTTSGEEMFTVPKLQPSTTYIFKIQGECKVGYSPPGEASNPIVTARKTLARVMIRHPNSKLITPLKSTPNVYKLPLDLAWEDTSKKVRHFTIGTDPRTIPQTKVLMIVGATGAGKSTLLNGIANYLLNVEWSDPYRFKVVTPEDEQTDHIGNQAFSQTEYITAYEFNNYGDMPGPFNLTIIDTPGYGDCRGINRDKQITTQIKEFFTDYNIVDHLDAVCFVTPAPGRLTPTQSYIIDSILSMYANDIEGNIALLVTFADGQEPPVLDSIKEANIPYTDYYKFNNSALFADNANAVHTHTSFDQLFWDMGMVSVQHFFDSLHHLEPKSLKLTKEVMRERGDMEATVQVLGPQVQSAISEMNNLQKEKELLQNLENRIEDSKHYEYTAEEEVLEKLELKPGTYVTNCVICNMTCHYPCRIPKDEDKLSCAAMQAGNCTCCPKHCHWSDHHNMTYRLETTTKRVKKVYAETLKQYQVASTGKEGKQRLIKNMETRYAKMKESALFLISKVKGCIGKLRTIALRPDPLSTTGYIDILIENEKRKCKRGWEERTKHLEEIRKHAELCEKIETEDTIV